MKCVIIDDEFRSREVLSALITAHCSGVRIAGEGSGVEQTISLIHEQRPDLVFLDVEMGDGSAFDVLAQFPKPSFHTIFVTCMNNYASQAALLTKSDYLLKPVLVSELKAIIKKLADI